MPWSLWNGTSEPGLYRTPDRASTDFKRRTRQEKNAPRLRGDFIQLERWMRLELATPPWQLSASKAGCYSGRRTANCSLTFGSLLRSRAGDGGSQRRSCPWLHPPVWVAQSAWSLPFISSRQRCFMASTMGAPRRRRSSRSKRQLIGRLLRAKRTMLR